MQAYSEDLRRKIVATLQRGTSKVQAAHLFDVSLSQVKRYVRIAGRVGSLAPKKVASPSKTDTLTLGTMSPPKGDPSAGTNTALITGVQAGSRPALPLLGEIHPDDGQGVGHRQQVIEEVTQATRGRLYGGFLPDERFPEAPRYFSADTFERIRVSLLSFSLYRQRVYGRARSPGNG